MEIEINGKTYRINEDIRFGVQYALQKEPENLDNHFRFFKEVLIPSPNQKEIFNFKESDREKIFDAWVEMKKQQTVEIKKKRSQF